MRAHIGRTVEEREYKRRNSFLLLCLNPLSLHTNSNLKWVFKQCRIVGCATTSPDGMRM